MKRILQWAMVLTLSTAVMHCSRDEAQTINGTNGKNGSTILSGTTAPTLNIGEIGDYYLNKSTYDLYGPKTSDSWGTPINLKGREGSNGTAGSKIHAGTGIPAQNIGNNGDWYIDTKNKMLYGPKTDQGWGSGLALGNSNASSLRGNYVLSRDRKTLLQWFDKETTQIDMQSDPELKEVTIIGKRAFYKGSLTSIILPDNLERIGNDAFMYNELISITIPNSVTSIGEDAFNGNQLTNITIPNGVTSIGYDAFSDNPLTNITIPNSVTTIGDRAFGYVLKHTSTVNRTVTIYAVTPPVITRYKSFPYSGIFGSHNPNLKIYVPAGSLTAYKTAEGWKEYASQIYAQ